MPVKDWVVWTAVKQDGSILYYASQRLRSDKEIVLMPVKQSRRALQHVGRELLNDKEIVLIAIRHQGGPSPHL